MVKRAAIISLCIICTAAIMYVFLALYNNALPEIAVNAGSSNALQNQTVLIARAKLTIKQGELLDVSRVEMVEVPVELSPQNAVISFSMLNNMRAKREISEKDFLNTADLIPKEAAYEEGDRLIEHNFAEGAVPAVVSEGSAVDIKLFVKGREDCVVISKAFVISRNGNLLAFYLDGTEQEYIKEAAVEGMLFAVQYIDTSQKESEVTYIPSYDKGRSELYAR
jgi:hypothetical protein